MFWLYFLGGYGPSSSNKLYCFLTTYIFFGGSLNYKKSSINCLGFSCLMDGAFCIWLFWLFLFWLLWLLWLIDFWICLYLSISEASSVKIKGSGFLFFCKSLNRLKVYIYNQIHTITMSSLVAIASSIIA